MSVATVSRVLNQSGPVRAETRRRILDITRRLAYSPNSAARALSTSRTGTLGVLLPDLYGEFFSEVIRGLDQTARRHEYHLLVSGSHDDAGEMRAALQAMRGRVDGLVVMWPEADTSALPAAVFEALPVVLINCSSPARAAAVLRIDNRGGARTMTRYLLEQGHRRIAFVAGIRGNTDAAERLRGFRMALREAGVDRAGCPELAGDFTEEGGYRAVEPLLALRRRPTAVFAANDSTAVGVISRLREAGLKVPQDIAVVGFDDVPIARYLNPPLTTMHVNMQQLGTRAIEMLLAAMGPGGLPADREEIVETMLVVRRSCAAPRARR